MNEIISNKNKKNMLMVFLSNLFTIGSSILVGFIIPKLMGLNDYGYYKVFTLYVGYVGFFSLGFCDGINLLFAGIEYSKLNEKKFNLFTRFYIYTQIIFVFIAIILSTFLFHGEYKFILIATSMYMLIANISGYYQHISQITLRFKELSIRNIIKGVLTFCSVLLILFLVKIGYISTLLYKVYVSIYILINGCIAVWYLFTYKKITFGKRDSIKENKKELFLLYKSGIPLMFSNLIVGVIFNLDRQFVSVSFSMEKYAIYAFAYNMLSIITLSVSSFSSIIYPIIKKNEGISLEKKYIYFRTVLLVVSSICLIAYFAIELIVNNYLPKYSASIKILRVIFPGIILTSSISIISLSFYKVLNKQYKYFINSIVAFVLSFLLNFLFLIIFKSMIAISIASIISLNLWYIITEIYLAKKIKNNWLKSYIYTFIVTIIFYLLTNISISLFFIAIAYALIIIILSYLFYKRDFVRR